MAVPAQLFAPSPPSLGDPLGISYYSAADNFSRRDGENGGSEKEDAGSEQNTAMSLRDKLIDAKQRFDRVSKVNFAIARSSCNPYESIGAGPFVNRSAMKLVNLDFAFDLASRARSRIPSTEFCFVDLCGAPGGFSEYLIWRGQERGIVTRGWGISLGTDIGEGRPTPWKIDDDEAFEICWGADGSGNLYSPANIEDFTGHVIAQCKARGSLVGLAVADGGFEAARDRADQERVMFRLIAAEVLAALLVLAPGGSLLVKLFDTEDPQTADLLWVVALVFERMSIVKPVTSRPASSERYLVGDNFRPPRSTRSSGEEESSLQEEDKMAVDNWSLEKILAFLWASLQCGDDDNAATATAAKALSELPKRLTSFDRYLNGVNHRLVSHQVAACEAILATVAGMATVEESAEDPSDLGGQPHPQGTPPDAGCSWWYLDPSGTSQGPFSAEQMSRWYAEGHFAAELVVCHHPGHGCVAPPSAEFSALGELVGLADDAGERPTQMAFGGCVAAAAPPAKRVSLKRLVGRSKKPRYTKDGLHQAYTAESKALLECWGLGRGED